MRTPLHTRLEEVFRLLQYLDDAGYLYFVREDVIEVVFEDNVIEIDY